MKKKFFAVLLSGVMAMSVVGCGNTNKAEDNNSNTNVESSTEATTSVAVKDIVDAVVNAGCIRMPAQADDDMAKDLYNLNLENIEEYAIAETQITPGVGLVMVVKAKEGKLDEVKSNVEAYRTAKLDGFNYPEEAKVYEASKVESVGNIVYYAVFNEEVSEAGQQAIADMLK